MPSQPVYQFQSVYQFHRFLLLTVVKTFPLLRITLSVSLPENLSHLWKIYAENPGGPGQANTCHYILFIAHLYCVGLRGNTRGFAEVPVTVVIIALTDIGEHLVLCVRGRCNSICHGRLSEVRRSSRTNVR
jgi:hypothetical protein